MTKVNDVIINYPEGEEAMKEIIRRFTVALAKIMVETMSSKDIDTLIEMYEEKEKQNKKKRTA